MKPFFNARRTRYTAAVMLFIWLMSLGISVANACAVQQDHQGGEYFSQTGTGTVPTAHAASEASPHHFTTNSVDSDEKESSTDKMACLHFCLAEQNTLVTDHVDGLDHIDLFPILFLTGLLAPATDQTSPSEAFASPTWSEPPVSIRYLRLTI